jgi:hypothetical protein
MFNYSQTVISDENQNIKCLIIWRNKNILSSTTRSGSRYRVMGRKGLSTNWRWISLQTSPLNHHSISLSSFFLVKKRKNLQPFLSLRFLLSVVWTINRTQFSFVTFWFLSISYWLSYLVIQIKEKHKYIFLPGRTEYELTISFS